MSSTRPATAERYLTVTEASALLGVSVVTIRRWIADGALPAVKLGPRPRGVARDNRPVRVIASSLADVIEPIRT